MDGLRQLSKTYAIEAPRWIRNLDRIQSGEEYMSTTLNNGISVIWELPQNQETIYVDELPPMTKKPVYEFLKRLFDVVFSLLALAVLLIPMAVIALVIVLDSPGKPIYAQVRLGLNQKPFRIYKFRSMYSDAEEEGLRWAENADPRITKVGSFLRKSRIDELPQLWNILIGDMSFVGPRPERPEFYEVFDTYIIGFRQRMLVKQGLTGLAQVNGGYDLKPEDKIRYDLEYIKTRSVWLDLSCVIRTITVVFDKRGAR